MSKVTTKIALAASATAMVMGLSALPVAAQSATATTTVGDANATATSTVTVDRSQTVNGNCSGIIITDVYQDQNTDVNQGQLNVAGNVNGLQDDDNTTTQTTTSTNSQSNSVSNSQSADVYFTPNCSVTNVTQSGEVKSAQVSAPKGGVDAGAGAFGSLLGLGGSLTAVAGGAARLFRRG